MLSLFYVSYEIIGLQSTNEKEGYLSPGLTEINAILINCVKCVCVGVNCLVHKLIYTTSVFS